MGVTLTRIFLHHPLQLGELRRRCKLREIEEQGVGHNSRKLHFLPIDRSGNSYAVYSNEDARQHIFLAARTLRQQGAGFLQCNLEEFGRVPHHMGHCIRILRSYLEIYLQVNFE